MRDRVTYVRYDAPLPRRALSGRARVRRRTDRVEINVELFTRSTRRVRRRKTTSPERLLKRFARSCVLARYVI